MSDAEFEAGAEEAEEEVLEAPRERAIPLACRGSADPSSLAWLAEALELADGELVVDVGGGLGGPGAWLTDRYRVRVVVTDPVFRAVATAHRAFGLAAVACTGAALPLRRADAALVLGVLSVLDRPEELLREVARTTRRLGVLEWCSTEDGPVHAGGSRFPTVEGLVDLLAAAGWTPSAGPGRSSLEPPPAWDLDGADPEGPEREVADAIGAGRLTPWVLVARPTGAC